MTNQLVCFVKINQIWEGYGIVDVSYLTMSNRENFSNCIWVLDDVVDKLNKDLSGNFSQVVEIIKHKW